MRSQLHFLTVLFAAALLACTAAEAATLEDQCNKYINKVSMCLTYATGKATTPSKDCCDSVTEIKGQDPVCLCYIILQTHNGSEEIKGIGIQEAKLIQLPTACKLTNASISDCPKLLKLPTNSPDYAIFTNTSSTSTTTPSTVAGTASPTTTDSAGSKHRPDQVVPLVAIAIAVFFLCGFPVEAVSTFST